MAETIYNSNYTGEQIDSAVAWLLKHEQDHICGGAVSGTTIAAPTDPTYWFVGAGTYTCGSSTITIPDGRIGIISYDGSSWSSETFDVGKSIVYLDSMGEDLDGTTVYIGPGMVIYDPDQLTIKKCTSPGVYEPIGCNENVLYCNKVTNITYRWNTRSMVQVGAANISIVNDLQTGGEDKALSAEMGKNLAQRVESLESTEHSITYDSTSHTFRIERISPTINVVGNVIISGSTKSGSFKVSGTHLKGDVTIATDADGWLLRVGNGMPQKTLTLSPTNGTLAETTVTAIYSGIGSSIGNTITISSTAAQTKSVTATYNEQAMPTIIVPSNSMSLEEVAGYTDSKVLAVSAALLSGNITHVLSGNGASRFSVSPSSLPSSGGDLTIVYTPVSGDNNIQAALTLKSQGAEDVVITLKGTAKVQSLTLDKSTLELSSAAGSPASGTIVVQGTNIKENVTIETPTGFTCDYNSLTPEQVNAVGGVELTITNAGVEASGTIRFLVGSTTLATASVEWNEADVEEVGAIIARTHGYANASAWESRETTPYDNATIRIKYKILTLPSGSTNGTVIVVRSDGKRGKKGTIDNYPGLYAYRVPATIVIGQGTYDVKYLGECCLGECSSLIYIDFETPTKLRECYTNTAVDPGYNNATSFFNSNNLVGTEMDGNIKVLKIPAGLENFTAINCDYIYAPSSMSSISFVDSGANSVKLIDFSNLSNGFHVGNRLYQCKALEVVVIRKSSSISNANYMSWGNWKSGTKVYVPQALIASYEANAQWAAGVSAGKVEFVALEGSPYETSPYNS